MVAHFLQPLANGLEGVAASYVVDEEDPDGLPVISIGDGTIPFLAGSVPNLGPNEDILDVDGVGCELDPNSGVRVTLELVFGISIE